MQVTSHATLQLVIGLAEDTRAGTPDLAFLQDIDFKDLGSMIQDPLLPATQENQSQ